MESLSSSSRTCQSCGKSHLQKNSPICSGCRKKFSKKPCPVPGCDIQINLHARTCLAHRTDPRFRKQDQYDCCAECGSTLKTSPVPVCVKCRREVRWLCKCGCGRYRQKYGSNGVVREYISGHNDNWDGNRRPKRACEICGALYRPVYSRQRLCGMACRTQWNRINPPNERKRITVQCDCCGTTIYRTPCQIREGASFACSQKCQYIIVANKLRGKNVTQGKKLALRRDGGRCRICGFDELVHVHHIIPKREGGPDEEANLITLCPNHHALADRGRLTAIELLAYL